MEIEVKESVSLEDGKHEGVIERIEYREEPFKYTDVFVKEKESGFELKFGCPTSAGINTKLMRLLSKFADIKPGIKVDPEKILLAKQVTFMTMQEEKGDKTYTRIVDGSVKPLVQEEKVTDK